MPDSLDGGNQIHCPNCGTVIDVHEVLHHQLEAELKKQFAEQQAVERQRIDEQLRAVEDEREALARSRQEQEAAQRKAIEEGVRAREKQLADELKQRIEAERAGQLEALNKELDEKTSQLKELHRTRSEVERLKREKETLREEIEARTEQKLNKALEQEREKIRNLVEQQTELDMAEKNKVISDLSRQLKDAQRKAEQGSMQLQGEVQELAIEEWLRDQFPLDSIEEIKKGSTGADCLQTIHTRNRQNCGTIYYESKRTKSFSPAWIEKFRQDIRDKGADVGVLVTQAMPTDMPAMGLRDGIWICGFEEFRGLAIVLRDAAIRMSAALTAQDNKGDKMGMLYDFLTGNEFRQQIEAIVEGFTQMQMDLESEKRSTQSSWKKREKQIEKVLLNTNHMYGSIRGIAGNAVQTVALLEHDESE